MRAATSLLIYVITVIDINYLCLADPVLMCYYPSTARLRPNIVKFEIKDINFTLCTHYIYLSAQIDSVSRTMVASDPTAEEGSSGLYREFVDAKNNVTSIKTLLSVGGDDGYFYNHFKVIGENDTILGKFVTSAVAFLRQHGFDGLEINLPNVVNTGKIAHTNLLKALREKFDEDTTNRLILTATCPGLEMYIDRGYDAVSMSKSVDYAMVATHQLSTEYVQLAQFFSALFSSETDPPCNTLSVNYSLHAWNKRGMPFNKMVVGFTGRGRMFELVSKSDYKPWAPIINSNYYGHFHAIRNVLTYLENCRIANQSQKYYDDVQKSPYMVHDNLWVGYDDSESLDLKIMWVRKLGVAGVMFSSLDEDDFLGTWCGKGKFPLLVAMNNAIMRVLPGNKKTTHISITTMSPTGGNATDKDGADKDGKDKDLKDNDGKDDIKSHPVLKETTEEDSNIMSNLLYGFLIVLIPIVCLTMAMLCGRRQRHQGE